MNESGPKFIVVIDESKLEIPAFGVRTAEGTPHDAKVAEGDYSCASILCLVKYISLFITKTYLYCGPTLTAQTTGIKPEFRSTTKTRRNIPWLPEGTR
jgi:hypothetical protein